MLNFRFHQQMNVLSNDSQCLFQLMSDGQRRIGIVSDGFFELDENDDVREEGDRGKNYSFGSIGNVMLLFLELVDLSLHVQFPVFPNQLTLFDFLEEYR